MLQDCLASILDENHRLLAGTDWRQVGHFLDRVSIAPVLFFSAQGRSGYILRAFCMRLMHLGLKSFFVGETITPPIRTGDMLIVLSGSGETALTCQTARIAKEAGALVYAIAGSEDNSLARLCDYGIVVPGGAKHGTAGGELSIQPPGSLFEQSAFFLLETVVLALCKQKNIEYEYLLLHHTNLE